MSHISINDTIPLFIMFSGSCHVSEFCYSAKLTLRKIKNNRSVYKASGFNLHWNQHVLKQLKFFILKVDASPQVCDTW